MAIGGVTIREREREIERERERHKNPGGEDAT
jgi:hypothetical protein